MRAGNRAIFAGIVARLAALVVVLAPCVRASAAEPVAGEYDLKAAFVYQFTHFTEWPAETFATEDAPIVVAVVGEDPFRGALARAVRDKTVYGRRLAYQHFPDADALAPCHILYVSPSEQHRLAQIVDEAGAFGALTVGDMDGFTRDGGMVRFIKEKNKVRFEIRRDAVDDAGLRLKAQLLRAARVYEE